MIHVGNKESSPSFKFWIRSRLRIGKKHFGFSLEGSDCMAILGATFFPFMLSFVSFHMTLEVQLFFFFFFFFFFSFNDLF
jgi:hypothetical protein